MKSYRTAIIAVIVLALAIAGFFVGRDLIERGKASASPTPGTSSGTEVLSFDAGQVVKIESRAEESFLLSKKGEDRWVCETPVGLTLRSGAATELLDTVNHMRGTLLFSKGEFKGNLSEYGLDRPAVFTLTMQDGSTLTVKTGGLTPSGTMYYIMKDGSDEIYTVSTMYGKRLKLTRSRLISGCLIELSDPEQLQTVEIRRKGELFCRLEEDPSADSTEGKAWKMTAPVTLEGNPTAVQKLTETLTGLTVFDTAEADCQDLSRYGLDTPAYQYIFTDKKGSASCEIGNKTPDGAFYFCTLNGDKTVFRLDADKVDFVDNGVLDYAHPYAFFENYNTLSGIDITFGSPVNESRKLTFLFGEDGSEQISLDGVPAMKAAENGDGGYDYLYEIKGITTYCYALQIDRIEASPSLPKGELACRITYHRQDGTSCTVEAYARDEATVCLYVDGTYMGGVCERWRIFSETDHQGLWGTIKAYEALVGGA